MHYARVVFFWTMCCTENGSVIAMCACVADGVGKLISVQVTKQQWECVDAIASEDLV